mmetsp:Transcript_73151/g.202882  ORF Transcript_73151/g.202882 Transcript_73151/m.202882 type:complete len:214 (+) Transcript_73151:1861-2502(+)
MYCTDIGLWLCPYISVLYVGNFIACARGRSALQQIGLRPRDIRNCLTHQPCYGMFPRLCRRISLHEIGGNNACLQGCPTLPQLCLGIMLREVDGSIACLLDEGALPRLPPRIRLLESDSSIASPWWRGVLPLSRIFTTTFALGAARFLHVCGRSMYKGSRRQTLHTTRPQQNTFQRPRCCACHQGSLLEVAAPKGRLGFERHLARLGGQRRTP